MKRILSYISLLLTVCLYGCVAEMDSPEPASGQVEVKLFLNMPGEDGEPMTRVGGTGTQEGDLDHTTQEQRYVRDITVLIIQDGKIIQVADDAKIDAQQGSNIRIVTLTADATKNPVDAMVLINARENGIIDTVLDNLEGKTLAEIHNLLIYTYPTDPTGAPNVWNLSARYLPMWGMTKNLDFSRIDNYGHCDIYRSVAKMAFMVDEACSGFQMEEIHIYHMEQKGYLMSGHEPDPAVNKQYTLPDVPGSSIQTGAGNSVMYDVTGNEITNRIFIPESDNKNPAGGKKQLKVVVGGTWNGDGIEGAGKKNYWRIDMTDDLDNPYDIIRNHSYVYNITKVDNPGTPTPDEALESAVATLRVEVEEWTPQYMRGVPDQYTLTTTRSVITLDGYTDVQQHAFDVWTDYGEGWTIDTDENGKIIDAGTDQPIEWLEINTVKGPYNQTVTVKVNAEKINLGGTRTNRFWIKAGNIRKEITVICPQPPTANSYVVGDSKQDGDYSIIVGIKGNGADGTRPEGVDIVPGEEGLSPEEDATLHPHTLGIIWETKAGLISLKHPVTGEYSTGATRVPYNPGTNSLDFKTNLDGAEIGHKEGGNALIGAFDENGVVLWSWHIWVCPEMYDPNTGQIIEEEFLEDWTISGYKFMDRNLGALSNVPFHEPLYSSVASMGLQYQWGRKDPFIGPAYSNDVFTGTGLLPVVHYYEEWGVNGSTTSTAQMPTAGRNIDYTVAHPTQLVYWNHTDGNPTSVVSLDEIGAHLWGTNKGFVSEDTKELGSKTIYDPCPVGYRVPPVDAFVFHSVYPQFPVGSKSDHTSTTVVNGTTYYENDYFRYYFVPDYQKPASTIEEANNLGADLTRYVRFLKLGRYDTDASGKEVFKPLEFYTIDEISKVFGFEHVFIQFYYTNDEGEAKTAYTATVYYEVLNEDTYVNPGTATTHFRVVKPTDIAENASVYDVNFNYNMVNIPWAPYKNKRFTRQWNKTNKIYAYMSKYQGDLTEGAYDPEDPKGTMIGNDYYYGFYLNYGSMDEPKMKKCRSQFLLDANNPETITWLPLTGAYDPTKGITFKTDGNKTIRVEAGSSITVNSFMWTNSTVTRGATVYPGGIALHGAEARGNNYTYYGQHIHGLSADDVQADRHYTAAVRCVRDVKKVTWDDVNSLTKSAKISVGGSTAITLKSVNGSWKLVDPGAPWLLVTPDKGDANGGVAESNITLKVKAGTAVGSTTTISFQIEGEETVRKCKVTVTE